VGAHAVILRPGVVYGPGDTDVFQVFRWVSYGLFASIGRVPGRFSLIYVDDLVEAILAASRASRAAGNTYFVSNPDPVSWPEFSAAAAARMGRGVRTLRVPAPVARCAACAADLAALIRRRPGIFSRDKVREALHPYWVCDPSRAERDFGFRAETSLTAGLEATLAWYRKAGWLTY
jgi:nucleoside-diphosphate-sugar epimerase